jgi:hypothetical protein
MLMTILDCHPQFKMLLLYMLINKSLDKEWKFACQQSSRVYGDWRSHTEPYAAPYLRGPQIAP